MKNSNIAKIIFFLLLITSFVVTKTSAQNTVVPSPKTDAQEAEMAKLRRQWTEKLGTFQIQIVNSRINPQIDVAIIEQIEAARKDSETVYLPYRDNIRIFILSRQTIEQKDFTRLDLFKYVQESH